MTNMEAIAQTPRWLLSSPASLREHPELPKHCRSALDWFVSQTSGVTAALVATTDGFEVCSIMHRAVSAEKISAMTSSILALGDAVLGEASHNGCENVVIESKSGLVLMLAVRDARQELLLSVVADKNAMLGQVLWAARKCCERICTGVALIDG